MTQHLADLAERGAVAQHLGGQSMAKLMGARGGRIDAGALERMPNDRSNATGTAKAADRALWRVEIRGDWCCAGRPCRRYAAIALPTSVGKGSSLRWPLLPRTLNCPAFQSMSSSSRKATSPERNPSRASRSKMA